MEERDEARAERDEARAERDEARAELEDIFYAPLTEAEAAPPSPESSSESVGSERLQGFFEGVASMQPELARVKALASQAQNRIRALTIALEQTRGSRAPAREEQIEEVLSILRPFSDLSDRLVTLRDGLQGLQTYVADMDQDHTQRLHDIGVDAEQAARTSGIAVSQLSLRATPKVAAAPKALPALPAVSKAAAFAPVRDPE